MKYLDIINMVILERGSLAMWGRITYNDNLFALLAYHQDKESDEYKYLSNKIALTMHELTVLQDTISSAVRKSVEETKHG